MLLELRAVCKDESGFEDQLMTNMDYEVIRYTNNSILLINDNKECKWYGLHNFDIEMDVLAE